MGNKMYSTEEYKKKEDLPTSNPYHGRQAGIAACSMSNSQNLSATNKGSVEPSTTSTIQMIGGQVETEASGGITEQNIQEIAETGVDFIVEIFVSIYK